MEKNRVFNNILDECLERLLVKSETIEQCLSSYPEYAAELRPLLETTAATREALDIQPRPEFKTRARYQFQSALRVSSAKKSLPFFRWQPQWAMAVVSILAVLLTGGGTVAAASYSMPDSPLYPVKLATEQVQLALANSDMNKARLYAKLADKRVNEVVYIASKGKSEQIEPTLERLNQYLVIIASLPLTEQLVMIEPPSEPSVMLAPQPEAAPRAMLAPAPGAEERARVEAEEPAPEITSPLPPPPPRSTEPEKEIVSPPTTAKGKLKTFLKQNSVKHPEKLRAVLDRVPESAKPALQRAIELSESSYNKAIDALD